MKKFLFVLAVLIAVSGSGLYAFTDTLDDSTPAGTDDPKQGDDRIRELKRAFIERLQVNHTFPAVGDTYDGATVGYHKHLTMPDQSGDPANVANTTLIYAKDDGTESSLYLQDESGNVKQIAQGDNLQLLLDEEGSDRGTAASQGALYTKDSGSQPELYYREESNGDVVQITSAGAVNHGLGTDRLIEAWGKVSYAAGSPTLDDSYNITSIADNGVGDLGVTIATDFANANYAVVASCDRDGGTNPCNDSHYTAATGTVNFLFTADGDGAPIDPATATFIMVGDQS